MEQIKRKGFRKVKKTIGLSVGALMATAQVYAFNNSSNLYQLYLLMTDVVDLVPKFVELGISIMTLIFMFIVLRFVKKLLDQIISNMRI